MDIVNIYKHGGNLQKAGFKSLRATARKDLNPGILSLLNV